MRFTINLATRIHLDHRRVKQACTGAILLLTLLLAWNAVRVSLNVMDMRRLDAESATMKARLDSRPAGVSEKEYTRLLASIRFYNDVIDRKSHRWLGLLDQLENATPDGVALVSLIPEKGGTELKLEGRAKTFGAVRSYLEKLEESRAFANILLLSHHELAVGEKGRGVQFTISCRTVAR